MGLNDSDQSTQEEKSPNPKKKKRHKRVRKPKDWIQRNHIAPKKMKYLNFGRPLMT